MTMLNRSLMAAAMVLCVTLGATEAHADADADARAMVRQAMEVDYLDTRFDEAAARLKKAIALCSDQDCSRKTRAWVHSSLAIVYIGGLNSRAEGQAQMIQALLQHPKHTPDPDYATPAVTTALEAARKQVAKMGPPPDAASDEDDEEEEDEEEDEEEPSRSGEPPVNGLVHEPADAQAVSTPLPVYAEAEEGTGAAKVQVRYRAHGAEQWKTLTLERMDEGYGGYVPCADVGTVTGPMAYYLQAVDESGDVVAWAGTRRDNYQVSIEQTLDGAPPQLPGQEPPAQCIAASDCPPDFPGCESASSGICIDDSDCDDGSSCDDGACRSEARDEGAQNWFTLEVQQDFLFFGSDSDVCSGGNQYFCYYEGDVYYDGIPYPDDGNEVAGGVGPANFRLLIGYDRALLDMFTVGVRLGYSFQGGPESPDGTPFLPVHAEARFAYWFGDSPFASSGFVPYVYVAGGLSEADAKVLVTIYEDEGSFARDERTQLHAWRKTGVGFAALGGGTTFKITDWTGLSADFRVMQLFGAGATGMALRAGYMVGL